MNLAADGVWKDICLIGPGFIKYGQPPPPMSLCNRNLETFYYCQYNNTGWFVR